MTARRWIVGIVAGAVLLAVWAQVSVAYGSAVRGLAEAFRDFAGFSGTWLVPGSLASRVVPVIVLVGVVPRDVRKGVTLAVAVVVAMFLGETVIAILSEPLHRVLGPEYAGRAVNVAATLVRYGVPFGFLGAALGIGARADQRSGLTTEP